MSVSTAIADEIFYPETDGKPMGDNTLQIKWMLMLMGNLQDYFLNEREIFVACNLNWYPVEGDNTKVTAPDLLVAFGRPKGERSSYMQWNEGGVPATVTIEILSPGNFKGELDEKFRFYERYGVEEYYNYDPNKNTLEGFRRKRNKLNALPQMDGWISPRMKIRFDLSDDELRVWKPDNTRFLAFTELAQTRREDCLRAEGQRKRAEDAEKRAEDEQKRAEKLLAKLKAHGIDPDA